MSFLVLPALLVSFSSLAAENTLIFGQVAGLTGSFSDASVGIRTGILAAFNEVNASGDTHGKKFELQSVDDRFEPFQTIEAVKKMIADSTIMGIVGATGSATTAAVMSMLSEAGMPLIASYSGANFLYSSSTTNVLNTRASYAQEAEKLVDYLTNQLKLTRISVFYQNDIGGYSGLEGVRLALEKRGLKIVSAGAYSRNNMDVKSAYKDLQKGAPEAIIAVSVTAAMAELVKQVRKSEKKIVLTGVSVADGGSLFQMVGAEAADIYITRVMPLFTDTTIPLVKKYQEAMKSVGAEKNIGFSSLEGYVAGRFVVALANDVQGQISRKSLIDTAHTVQHFDIDGFKLSYGPNEFGSSQVYLTQIQSDGTLIDVNNKSPAVKP